MLRRELLITFVGRQAEAILRCQSALLEVPLEVVEYTGVKRAL